MKQKNHVKLDNLTEQQVTLLDKMWSIDSVQELDEFYTTLSYSDRCMAKTLEQILIMDLMDEQWTADLSEANRMIQNIMQ